MNPAYPSECNQGTRGRVTRCGFSFLSVPYAGLHGHAHLESPNAYRSDVLMLGFDLNLVRGDSEEFNRADLYQTIEDFEIEDGGRSLAHSQRLKEHLPLSE